MKTSLELTFKLLMIVVLILGSLNLKIPVTMAYESGELPLYAVNEDNDKGQNDLDYDVNVDVGESKEIDNLEFIDNDEDIIEEDVTDLGVEDDNEDMTEVSDEIEMVRSIDVFEDRLLARHVAQQVNSFSANEYSYVSTLSLLNLRSLSANGVSSLAGIERLPSLEGLLLHNIDIADFSPLSQLPHLRVLELWDVRVWNPETIGLLESLEEIVIVPSHSIDDVSFLSNFPNLSILSFVGGRVSDFSEIANLQNLVILNLRQTQISDLQPLASLQSLTMLYLDDNQISDLQPLANLQNLTMLYLNDNQITDLQPLANLQNLTELRLQPGSPNT